MSDLLTYIIMRDSPSGCHYAKEHECLKHKSCDECAKSHITEHDKKIRTDVINEILNIIDCDNTNCEDCEFFDYEDDLGQLVSYCKLKKPKM